MQLIKCVSDITSDRKISGTYQQIESSQNSFRNLNIDDLIKNYSRGSSLYRILVEIRPDTFQPRASVFRNGCSNCEWLLLFITGVY